jgi:hypothetical protein
MMTESSNLALRLGGSLSRRVKSDFAILIYFKLARATVPAHFFLAALAAIGCASVTLEDIRVAGGRSGFLAAQRSLRNGLGWGLEFVLDIFAHIDWPFHVEQFVKLPRGDYPHNARICNDLERQRVSASISRWHVVVDVAPINAKNPWP